MTDCLIIGGGLIGLLTARELHQSGMRVTLLEKGHTGQESSWAGGGILSPLYPWRYSDEVTRLAQWSQQRYPALVQELIAESGLDPEYTPSGHLILDSEEQDEAKKWAEQFNYRLQILGPEEIHQYEPELAASHSNAICLPDVAQIRNPRLLKTLRKAVEGKITILEQTPAKKILFENNKAIGVKASSQTLYADNIVVCAGAWTQKLLSSLTHAPNIEPVHGQMILFKTEPGLIKRIVLKKDRYVIPRRDGRVLVGSSLENNEFQKITTPETRKELKERATELFPALAKFPIEKHWAGLRPSSPQGIPYIGEHPEINGLFINSGHFRNGVVLGPASCRLISEIILKRPTILSGVNYRLDRPR